MFEKMKRFFKSNRTNELLESIIETQLNSLRATLEHQKSLDGILERIMTSPKYTNKLVTFGEIRPLNTKETPIELNVKPLVIKQTKCKQDLNFRFPGEDVYALAESSEKIYKFNFWLHYNPKTIDGYPFSWSIFGNRSGDYYKGEEEMIESLKKFWRGLIVKNLTIN